MSEIEFVVEDVFEVTGRGPVITRSQEAARGAWDRGDRWEMGDEIVCGSLHAVVVGIERFCVPPSHPAHNDAALLLRGVEKGDLQPGQVWSRVAPYVTEPPALSAASLHQAIVEGAAREGMDP